MEDNLTLFKAFCERLMLYNVGNELPLFRGWKSIHYEEFDIQYSWTFIVTSYSNGFSQHVTAIRNIGIISDLSKNVKD